MNYKMEELVPIVGRLAEKYTFSESTSITYEKAQQLMEAVLYSIHEMELSEHDSIITTQKISAKQAYEIGMKDIEQKTKQALEWYNEMLPKFCCYENRCLYDTFVKGLPEFFKWYDMQFEPQNTILTLDYPVLRDLSKYTGIDKIYEYIQCIDLEQKYLGTFPEDYIEKVLMKYNRRYQDRMDNICEIILFTVIGHFLLRKPLAEVYFEEADYRKIQTIILQNNISDLEQQLRNGLRTFVQKYCNSNSRILEYVTGAMNNIIVRLKNAAEHRVLSQLF